MESLNNWFPRSSRSALEILDAIYKWRFYFTMTVQHHMGMWTLPDPVCQWRLCHSPPWKCLPLSAPFEISHLPCFFISSQTSFSSSLKPSLSSCSKRWCVCFARRTPRGPPFIALCRLFYLSDRHAPPRIVPGYQSSPADHITACVRLWPISGFTSKSDSYHYLRDK